MKLEITGQNIRMPVAACHCSYKLNGVEIGPHLRSLDLHVCAGELVTVKMEIFVDDLVVDADVLVEIKEAIRDKEEEICQQPTIGVTEDELAAAFTEWAERYMKDPGDYADESGHWHNEGYGRSCAKHLYQILLDLDRASRAAKSLVP